MVISTIYVSLKELLVIHLTLLHQLLHFQNQQVLLDHLRPSNILLSAVVAAVAEVQLQVAIQAAVVVVLAVYKEEE
jgi:hypothetical protein